MNIRLTGIAAILIAPLVITGCASKHTGLDGNETQSQKTHAFPMSERTCLMRAMYFESSRSSRDGMIAVGTVVMNRVNSTAYPKTICGVVGQPKQFAPGVLTREMKEPQSVARAQEAADAVLRGERAKKSKNAMFFHTAGLSFPYKNMHYVQVAGGNAFYEKRKRDGSLQVPVNDAPYDVAFAFAQERSGNAPQFDNPVVVPATSTPSIINEQAPVIVAQAQTIQPETQLVAHNIQNDIASDNNTPNLTVLTPKSKAPIVVQADYSFVPTPIPSPLDHVETGSILVSYAMPSKQKFDEIGAILQQQKRYR